ncbi:MAG: hypothetical protein H0X64_15820, partial [Gemmatimonadaceae bacterium]|nr:hypothetical protein [Gemmatimonadaceae bacterium]
GGEVSVAVESDGVPTSADVPPALVRTVIGRALLGAIDAGGAEVQLCGREGATVFVVSGRKGAPVLDEATAGAARRAGVGVRLDGSQLTLTFPAAAPPPAPVETATHGIA